MTWTGAELQRIKNIEDVLINTLNDYIVDYVVDVNITLTPIALNQYSIDETSLDGNDISLNGSLYLLYAQTNLSENGIYAVSSLNPVVLTRYENFKTFSQIQGRVGTGSRVQKKNTQNFYFATTTEPFDLGITDIAISLATQPAPVPTTLEELTDVNIANPREGAMLQYSAGKWQDTLELTTDGTFASSSDSTIPTSQAIKTKLDNLVIDGGVF